LTTLLPNTITPQSYKLRIRETGSQTPFSIVIQLQDEFTYVSQSIIPTASMADDWLVITGSFNLSPNTFYQYVIQQKSGSTTIGELYRGEIYATTASATILNTEPMYGYVASSSVNQYIVYE